LTPKLCLFAVAADARYEEWWRTGFDFHLGSLSKLFWFSSRLIPRYPHSFFTLIRRNGEHIRMERRSYRPVLAIVGRVSHQFSATHYAHRLLIRRQSHHAGNQQRFPVVSFIFDPVSQFAHHFDIQSIEGLSKQALSGTHHRCSQPEFLRIPRSIRRQVCSEPGAAQRNPALPVSSPNRSPSNRRPTPDTPFRSAVHTKPIPLADIQDVRVVGDGLKGPRRRSTGSRVRFGDANKILNRVDFPAPFAQQARYLLLDNDRLTSSTPLFLP
jgi:hypothetical protein